MTDTDRLVAAMAHFIAEVAQGRESTFALDFRTHEGERAELKITAAEGEVRVHVHKVRREPMPQFPSKKGGAS